MSVAALVSLGLLLGIAASQPAAATTAPSSTTLMSWAQSVLTAMNHERAHHGLPPLRMNYYLKHSALAHNRYMERYNTMSHRLPGEADLGPRIARAGYSPWCAVGENVAWNTDISLNGLFYLQRIMYNELPPDDGHRRIILSRAYVDVGINVQYDAAHGKLWMTEDFGHLCG